MKSSIFKPVTWILLFWISIFNTQAVSQNLIRNNGFDIQQKGYLDRIYTSDDWYWNNNTSCYYRICATRCGNYHPSANEAKATSKEARSKMVFAGLYALGNNNKRGFISTKLISPLDSGQTYYFEMYVQLGFFSTFAINQISVLFSSDSIGIYEKERINADYISEVLKKTEKLILQKGDKTWINDRTWTPVFGFYKAKGDEQYIHIGNPLLNRGTKKMKVMKSEVQDTLCFYFIDDVSLIKYDNQFENIKIGESLVINNIIFELNKASLLPESFDILNKLIAYLQKKQRTKLEISGHTDNTGNKEHNLKLSEQRAKAVVDYLVHNGIDASRLSFKGYGDSKPVTDNESEEGRKKNRRVEITIVE